jgi:uncharacterized protein
VISILLFALVGFLAQLVDGLLGMGYGITGTSLLLALGLPPALASASVHAAEAVASGASAIAHIRYRNVIWSIARRLTVPGIAGAVCGALLVSNVPGPQMKAIIAAYLFLLGIRVLVQAFRPGIPRATEPKLIPLGLAGGFCDAFGGGWGPIVTSSLLARGEAPRTTIGSVNVAEFFVTVAITVTFGLNLGTFDWRPVLGLAIGGIVAAPLAAKLTGRVPTRPLKIAVGVLVILLSVRTILALL